MTGESPIYLTEDDLERLSQLLHGQRGRFDKLENELSRAVVVPPEEIPRDVVTMNSRVVFEDETTGERREITLVYPWEADIDAGKISVLVPVGTALLGLRSRQSITFRTRDGRPQMLTVLAVWPPESEDDDGPRAA